MALPPKSRFELGSWNVICDSCGRTKKNHEVRKTWDGRYVCPSHWEARHPQDFVRAQAEKETPDFVRPPGADVEVSARPPTISVLDSGSIQAEIDNTICLQAVGVLQEWEYTVSSPEGTLTPSAVTFLPGQTRVCLTGVFPAQGAATINVGDLAFPITVLPPPPAPVSTIAYKAKSTLTTNGGFTSSQAFSFPGTSADGDLCIFIAISTPSRIISASAGWTELASLAITSGGNGATCKVFGRVKQSGDTGVTISISGGTAFIIGFMLAYSGQQADYLDAVVVSENNTASTTIAFPAANAEYANTQVLLVAIQAKTGFPWFDLPTLGNLTSPAELEDSGYSAGNGGVFAAVRATALVEDSLGVVSGLSNTSAAYSTCVIVLR